MTLALFRTIEFTMKLTEALLLEYNCFQDKKTAQQTWMTDVEEKT